MKWIAIIALATLSACGADGEPMRPTAGGSVSVSNHGIDTDARIGATNGRVAVGLRLF